LEVATQECAIYLKRTVVAASSFCHDVHLSDFDVGSDTGSGEKAILFRVTVDEHRLERTEDIYRRVRNRVGCLGNRNEDIAVGVGANCVDVVPVHRQIDD